MGTITFNGLDEFVVIRGDVSEDERAEGAIIVVPDPMGRGVRVNIRAL
jgi:hypothetical protein